MEKFNIRLGIVGFSGSDLVAGTCFHRFAAAEEIHSEIMIYDLFILNSAEYFYQYMQQITALNIEQNIKIIIKIKNTQYSQLVHFYYFTFNL